MGVFGNGVSAANGNGARKAPPPAAAEATARVPRRLVLLADGEASAVVQVLAEYTGAEVSGKRLHADLQRLAAEHAGLCVAAEWRGKLGWTRFLWCRK
jgi:hypothetical protein